MVRGILGTAMPHRRLPHLRTRNPTTHAAVSIVMMKSSSHLYGLSMSAFLPGQPTIHQPEERKTQVGCQRSSPKLGTSRHWIQSCRRRNIYPATDLRLQSPVAHPFRSLGSCLVRHHETSWQRHACLSSSYHRPRTHSPPQHNFSASERL